jgi:hypothetical protein
MRILMGLAMVAGLAVAAYPAKAQMAGGAEIAVLAAIATSLGAGPAGSVAIEGADSLFSGMSSEDREKAEKLAASADWSKARKVTLKVSDNLHPASLLLKEGAPYILRVESSDCRARLRANGFFSKAAIAKVTGGEEETGGPEIGSVSVPADSAREVYLVPMAKGVYEMDNGFLTSAWGMVGRIEVY